MRGKPQAIIYIELTSCFVGDLHSEVWMVECLAHCNSLSWIKCQQSSNKVQELLVDDVGG